MTSEVNLKPKKQPKRESPPEVYEGLSPQGNWIKVIIENDGTVKAVISASRAHKYAATPFALEQV